MSKEDNSEHKILAINIEDFQESSSPNKKNLMKTTITPSKTRRLSKPIKIGTTHVSPQTSQFSQAPSTISLDISSNSTPIQFNSINSSYNPLASKLKKSVSQSKLDDVSRRRSKIDDDKMMEVSKYMKRNSHGKISRLDKAELEMLQKHQEKLELQKKLTKLRNEGSGIDCNSIDEKQVIFMQKVLRGFMTRKVYNVKRKRLQIALVTEAVDTEESLLNKMNVMKNDYRMKLSSVGQDEVKQQVKLMFDYLDECIKSSEQIVKYGRQFLSEVSITTDPSVFFGYVTFHLWSYGEYTINYSISKMMLNSLMKNPISQRLILIINNNQPNRWCLNDLLIEPMQRTPRYPLLLNSVIKGTQKYAPEYNALMNVKKDYDFFTSLVNEKTKMRDDLMTLAAAMDFTDIIIPRRYYIGGEVMTINKKRVENHLFNDRMIWFSVTKQTKSGKPNIYNIEGEFLFDDKSTVSQNKHSISVIRFGCMPITFTFEKKKIAKNWKDTIDNLLLCKLYDVENENSWMNSIDCHMSFESFIEPLISQKPKETPKKK